MSDPRILLVTVLYNSDEVIEEFLWSVGNQKGSNYHLYMVDNSPKPLSADYVAHLCSIYGVKKFTLVSNRVNNGIAGGNNQGVRFGIEQGFDYILLLNNDIVFRDENLFASMETCVSLEKPLLVPKILFHGTNKIWTAGGGFLEKRGLTYHYGEGREENLAEFNEPKMVDYAPTCFMLVRTELFKKFGEFDEDYFVYFDDSDWIFRLKKNGISIWYEPSWLVEHKVSFNTGGNSSPFTQYYINRNRILFISKNLNGLNKVLAYAYTLLTRIPKLVFNGNRRAILRGVVAGVKMVRDGTFDKTRFTLL